MTLKNVNLQKNQYKLYKNLNEIKWLYVYKKYNLLKHKLTEFE